MVRPNSMNGLAHANRPLSRDHVGSLLRPQAVQDARKAFFETQSISAQTLKAAADDAIRELAAMQIDVGLAAVTDGEVRRSFWHYDFMGGPNGLDLVERSEGVQFQGATLRPIFPTITGRLSFPSDHPMPSHFDYLASVSEAQPKISTPSPSCCHFRTARTDIIPLEYADLELLFSDLERTYADAVQAF